MKNGLIHVVVTVASLAALVCAQEYNHDDVNAFADVREYFQTKGHTLTFNSTTFLIRHVLYRSNCLSRGADCQNCLDTGSVLRYLNRTLQMSLDEKAFRQLAVILVVFMKDLRQECAISNLTVVKRRRTFEQFVQIMTSDPHETSPHSLGHVHVDGQMLEEILHVIEENHRPGELVLDRNAVLLENRSRINYMSDIKYVSPRSLYEELDVDMGADFHGEELEELAALIISRILQGYCISPRDLPSPVGFLAGIFSSYGDKSTGKIDLHSFEEMLTGLGVGKTDEDAEKEDESLHAHSRRRRSTLEKSLFESETVLRRDKRATGHGHESRFSVSHNCYSAEQLLDVYTENRSASLTADLFGSVCPAIIQQILSGVCGEQTEEEQSSSTAEAYGYGTLTVFIITLCTLLGIVFVRIQNPDIRRRVIVFLVSLAIGTLLGDAMLHLIPEATGIHGHGSSGGDSHNHGAAVIQVEGYVWKMMAILASLYAFFLLELVMNKSVPPHGHSHEFDHEYSLSQITTVDQYRQDIGVIDGHKENGVKNEQVSYQTGSRKQNTPVDQQKPQLRNRALVIMVIVGDAFHNFADGMAIGAAFSLSVSGGISTSIAILCHEIPHELGDFAALIASGLSIKRALIMNLVSGCTAFIGLYVGLAVGGNGEGRVWVFVIAAGMFIYVALADLVPEVVKSFTAAKDTWITFICINAGILLGFVLMFLIAVFEEYIRFG